MILRFKKDYMNTLIAYTFFCRPPIIRVSDKVMIPQEEHPDINFVGLLIGPRGNTLKNLEKDVSEGRIIKMPLLISIPFMPLVAKTGQADIVLSFRQKMSPKKIFLGVILMNQTTELLE